MKKRMVAMVLSLAMIMTSVPAYAAGDQSAAPVDTGLEKSSDFEEYLESKYVDPDRVYSSDVRWWLGQASNTDEVLLDEIQALYDGGFRGVELCMQTDTTAAEEDYAYGSEMWAHKWNLMMNKLLDLGMGVYLTSGTNWATSNVPASSLDPSSEAALQVLAISDVSKAMIVKAGETFSGALELPASPKKNTKLNTVYAYKVAKTDDGTDRTSIVFGSAIKLYDKRDTNHESYVTKGESDTDYTVNWKAPQGEGEYQIIATWSQGAYNSSSPGIEECYTTNYFDERGVEALKSFWEEHYLSDPELAKKIKNGDVQLFMDSLELTYGDGFTWWSEDAVEQFKEIKGYDPMPYIIMVSGIGSGFEFALNTYYDMNGVNDFIFGAKNMSTFMLEDSEDYDYLTLREQLVNDWQDVMTQLYETRMLMPLKKWLNSVGIKTRAQISYGKAMEITEPSAYVDYPEAENLNQYNQVDILRLHTAGAKLQNKVLSTETGGNEDRYGQSYQRLLDEIYSQYAAGFQRVVWHIWTSNFGYGNWDWPGYTSGSSGFYRWGNREPSYVNYDEFNAHIARIQQLLQTGKSRTDIGFIHNSWAQGMRTNGEDGTFSQKSKNWQYAHEGVHYRSTELQDHGYTYDYLSPDLLTIDRTGDSDYVAMPNEVTKVVYNKETGILEGAGYRALVIYQDWMDPDGAETVLDLAKQGMPVVILENAAKLSTFQSDVSNKGNKLSDIMKEMKALPNVKEAAVNDKEVNYRKGETGAYDDDVYEKLVELGVTPYAEFEKENHQLLTQTRVDEGGNMYLYAYNYCPNDYHQHSSKKDVQTENHGTNIKTNIKMDGLYIPYMIDSYTGEVTELAQYTYEDGKTVFLIDLDYTNIALYAFEKVDAQKADTIKSTTAASSYMSKDGSVIRVTKKGVYATELNNGKTVISKVDNMAAASDIKNWNLDVTSWTKGDEILTSTEKIGDLTTVNKLTATKKTVIKDIKLDTLTTWDKIAQIGKNVSGTGVYTAEFDWDTAKADGAYIDFGDKLDQSMTVEINGVKVGGAESQNPTKAVAKVTGKVFDENGKEVDYKGADERSQYTGGVSWDKPIADVGQYLKNGKNTIKIVYNSSITNAAIAAGIVKERDMVGSAWYGAKSIWWGTDITYRSNGPAQAKLVPYKDVNLTAQAANDEAAVKEAKKQLEEAKKQLEELKKQADASEKALKQALEEVKAAKKQLEKVTFINRKVSVKVKATGKKRMKVTVKKVSGAQGYQIQYAMKSNMKGKKVVNAKGTNKVIKKLKKGKTYFVRARAYKTIDGKKVYTGFGVKKRVKIK